MSTNVHAVINAAADAADTLLDGVVKPADARPILKDWLVDNHPELSQIDRDAVIAEVIALLDEEDFFAIGAGTTDDDDPADASEPDE